MRTFTFSGRWAKITPYLLVAGERRLRAVRDVLKRGAIAAIMRHDLTEDTAVEATVLENLQRRDLHPMEEARGLIRLRAGHGYSVDKLAARLGRSKGGPVHMTEALPHIT